MGKERDSSGWRITVSSYLMTSPVSHGCCHDDAAAKLVMQGYFSCLASENRLQLSVLCLLSDCFVFMLSMRDHVYYLITDFLFDYVVNVCNTRFFIC